jgi:Domain of unknown function (DUF4258)
MEPIVIWDDEPGGNVEHIAEHDITPGEVEDVLRNPDNETDVSHSSGYPITFGWTETGRHIAVVWEEVDDDPRTIYPITAYEVPERRS